MSPYHNNGIFMSTAKACGYVFFFSGSKFPLCITHCIFGFLWLVVFFFFWQYIQLFRPTNQSDVASLCKARPHVSTEVSGTAPSLSLPGAASSPLPLLPLFPVWFCHLYPEVALLKQTFFSSKPPACYSSLLFDQSLLTFSCLYLSSSPPVSSAQSERWPGQAPWLGIFFWYLPWCRAESRPKSALLWPLLVLGCLKIHEEFWATGV